MRLVRKKLVVVGDDACGKTSLLAVFRGDRFPEHTSTTQLLHSVSFVDVAGTPVEFTLCETADQGGFKLRRLCYTNADVVLICFSVDLSTSLAHVTQKWAREVRQFCPNVPIILVANKTDLRSVQLPIEKFGGMGLQPVTYAQGRTAAREIGAVVYVECSAKNKHGVQNVFEKAAIATLTKKADPKKKSCCIQ